MTRIALRAWLVDLVVGGIMGGIAGAIVALNLVLYYGVERGYEASLKEVFESSALLGVVVVGILVSGPVLGALTLHVHRMKRSRTPSH